MARFLILLLLVACGPMDPSPHPWWTESDPCPPGTELVGAPPPENIAVICQRPDGTRHGRATAWSRFDHELLATGEYRNDRCHGTWTTWNRDEFYQLSDGYRSEVRFRDGSGNGPWKSWWRNGQLHSAGVARNGRYVGTARQWWPDGTLRAIGTDFDEMGNGTWTHWTRTGELEWWHREQPCPEGSVLQGRPLDEVRCARADGTRHGRFTMWIVGDHKSIEGQYVDGVPHGRWYGLSSSRDVAVIQDYEMGELVRHEEWDLDEDYLPSNGWRHGGIGATN